MKLLIAEDDFTSRAMLTAVTSKWGYAVSAVENGEAAWQVLLEPEAPQLLLIDWEMPELDGLGLCQRVRQLADDNPPFIILLTARSATDDVVAGLQAGANDYIAKPFANAELKARLQVGQKMLELQGKLKQAHDALAYERDAIENIILKMRASKPFDISRLRYLDVPVEKTSGDILLSSTRPDKTQHIMLGDFTGHGLMAAVGGPLVFDIFYSMTAKGLPMQVVGAEINRQLLEKMPTQLFLGAVLMELKADRQSLSIWNCGMSDILHYRDSEIIQKYPSNLLALGIVEQVFDRYTELDVKNNDRVYAYSDGITETANHADEEFGQHRLEQAIREMLMSREGITYLSNALQHYKGEAEQFDDITLVELTC